MEFIMSIKAVVIAVMVLIAVLGWGFLAGSYDGAHSGKFSEGTSGDDSRLSSHVNSDKARFFVNAIEQLPRFGTVISWNFYHRIWLPAIVVALEVLTLLGGLYMKRVERELSQDRRRFRS
jgi:hypothetical protein